MEGPATHLRLVSIACRSYETKPDFAGPRCSLLCIRERLYLYVRVLVSGCQSETETKPGFKVRSMNGLFYYSHDMIHALVAHLGIQVRLNQHVLE